MHALLLTSTYTHNIYIHTISIQPLYHQGLQLADHSIYLTFADQYYCTSLALHLGENYWSLLLVFSFCFRIILRHITSIIDIMYQIPTQPWDATSDFTKDPLPLTQGQSEKFNRVQTELEPFNISLELMKDIGDRLTSQMVKGLDKATHPESKVKMFPTYVQSLPDGTERGDFFALDLGGSNFRVLLVQLLEGEVKMESKTYAIAKEIMVGTGAQLFDYIADCLKEFKTEQGLGNKSLPLGFTFSFPCKQTSLKAGTLVTWTKGFTAEGVEGQNVVDLLMEACKRRGVDIDVIALVNDTTGTLMSCAYSDHNTYVGLILGTGTNACYMEDVNKVGTWEGDENARQTIVNMEWGAFGDDGVLDEVRTEYDRTVDESSLNKGKQLYEKMISGMYLGEISRQVMSKLTKSKLLFNGVSSEELETPGTFETRFLTDIENDKSNNGTDVTKILTDLNLKPSQDDIELVRIICHSVAQRAARLAVAGLAAVTKRVQRENRPEVTIGIDGTLYKKHPLFKGEMEDMMKQLVPGVKVNFMLSEDGSGKGAALIAAVACRLHNKGQ